MGEREGVALSSQPSGSTLMGEREGGDVPLSALGVNADG
jgi:hypothetical protein